MTILSRRTYFVHALLLILLMSLLLPRCKQELSKTVGIEYDQSMNFKMYKFQKTLVAGQRAWDSIQAVDNTDRNSLPKQGVWILYQICSIQNDASKAENFNYDVSKFYVDYGGQRHYYRPLADLTYADGSDSTLLGAPDVTAVLAPVFREETQTGPDQHIIQAKSTATLSVSWRFVIYVPAIRGDTTDLTTVDLPLRYDGTPVLMVNRNNDTVPVRDPISMGAFPCACRPPRQ